jgi:hypothetical protein
MQTQLDELYRTASAAFAQIRSFETNLDELCSLKVLNLSPYAIQRELESAHTCLLAWFRGQVHSVLAEGKDLKFPEDFLERALEVTEPPAEESVWSRWDSAKVLSCREKTFPNLDEAEWEQALRTAVRTAGVALERHDSEQSLRWRKRPAKPDELEIWCGLYERDSCIPSKLRTGSRERVTDLHTTLRVIEKLHLDCSYQAAALMVPSVLNPAYGREFEPGAIYRWHGTYNHGIPKIRVMADRSIVLKFASAELLQKLKEQLLPILNH